MHGDPRDLLWVAIAWTLAGVFVGAAVGLALVATLRMIQL